MAAHFLDAPTGGLASLTGLTSLNSLAAANAYLPQALSGHWPGMNYPADPRDDVISLMTGMRSRQNSYCSHGSRWSYSSHVEQSFANMRSASRQAGNGENSSSGTRSCRNSLLAPSSAQLRGMMAQESCQHCSDQQSIANTNNEASLSDDVSLWPPDYLVRSAKIILHVLVRSYFCFACFSSFISQWMLPPAFLCRYFLMSSSRYALYSFCLSCFLESFS